MKHHSTLVAEAVVNRLNLLLHFDIESESDPMELVRLGLIDPMKLFVKMEPHKRAKLLEKRLRLIFSMSVVDNIIAALLFNTQNKKEISLWSELCVKPGMGLNDSGMRHIYDYVRENSAGGIAEADIKGWDWSFQELDFQADLKRRIFLNDSAGTHWERVARAHYHCVARKVLVLSDGSMFKQMLPGILPSGWRNTSSTNSASRVINHAHAAMLENVDPWCMAMGDDSVERLVPNMIEHLQSLGKTCGLYNEVSSEAFEFCSTQFTNGRGVPVNRDKSLFKLLSAIPKSYVDGCERVDQFTYEMRNAPDLPDLLDVVHGSGWYDTLPPPEFFKL